METTTAGVTLLCALVLLTAGCVGGGTTGNGTGTPTDTPDATPTVTPTVTPSTGPNGTATPGGHERASSQPDPDKVLTLDNQADESVELTVAVVREATNETVHADTYEVAAGAERTVFDIATTDPDGIEAYTITASLGESKQTVSIKTNNCYGNEVTAEVDADGSLYLSHAIC